MLKKKNILRLTSVDELKVKCWGHKNTVEALSPRTFTYLIHICFSLWSLSGRLKGKLKLRINCVILNSLTWFVTWTRNKALTKTASACPSLKYSFNVVLNFFEYFTNSFLRCSTACFPDVPGMKPTTSFTASSSFLMALAISLLIKKISLKVQQNSSCQLTLLFQGKFCDQWSRQGSDSRCVWVRLTSC